MKAHYTLQIEFPATEKFDIPGYIFEEMLHLMARGLRTQGAAPNKATVKCIKLLHRVHTMSEKTTLTANWKEPS